MEGYLSGRGGFGAPVQGSLRREGEENAPLGTGEAHVHQTPFLFQLGVVGAFAKDGTRMRKQALFDAHQKDDGEFEPLGGVERHKRHGVVGFGVFVGAAFESGFR